MQIPLLIFPLAMEQGIHNESILLLKTCVSQSLHWSEVCQAGAVHDHGEAGAEIQDGVQGGGSGCSHIFCFRTGQAYQHKVY